MKLEIKTEKEILQRLIDSEFYSSDCKWVSVNNVKKAFALYRKRMSCHMYNPEMVDDEQSIAEDCFGKEMEYKDE